MKAVVINEPYHVSITDMDMPIPKEGEALLQILYCGFCGADVASYTGNQPFTTYPRVPGHEFSARIVSVPKNDKGLMAGDVVTCNPYFNCGACYSCKRGYVNCCTDNQTMGVQRDGVYQEYIAMPIERIFKGKGLDAQTLALVEPFCIGYHGLSRCNIKKTDRVLVVGGGPIGIFAMLSAKAKGAKVYVCDVLRGRLDIALQMGADGVCHSKETDLEAFAKGVVGEDGFDVCVECCGLPETFLTCIERAAFAGQLILIVNGKRETTFLHSALLKKELNVYGSRNAFSQDFEKVIDLLVNGKVDLSPMISRSYPIDEAKEAFEALCHNDGQLMKVLLCVANEEKEVAQCL